MVAFEMAQQLEKADEKVALLVFLAPSTPQHDQLLRRAPRNIIGSSTNRRLFRDKVSRHLQKLELLRLQQRLTYLLRRVIHRARGIAQRLACNVYFGLSYPLPPVLRSSYI